MGTEPSQKNSQRRFSLKAAVVMALAVTTTIAFQNCSESKPLPPSSSAPSVAGTPRQTMISSTGASLKPNASGSVEIVLENFSADDVLQWRLVSADAEFEVVSGAVNVSARDTLALIALRSKDVANAVAKVFSLEIWSVTKPDVATMTNVVLEPNPFTPMLSVAAHSNCAAVGGRVKCWGRNVSSELTGTGERLVPTELGFSGQVSYINQGGFHGCAIIGGALSCWGRNNHGQLGDETVTTTNKQQPVPVSGLQSGVTKVSAGEYHTCAIKDGAAYCWGVNERGQLGRGSTSTREAIPALVRGLTSGVSDISVGRDFTCAIHNNVVKCWGENAYGNLADGTTTDRNIPVVSNLIPGSGTPTQIVAGYAHACAIVDGRIQCWGYNEFGQLGDGSTSNRNVARQVEGILSGATQVVAAVRHTCAIVNGGVKCWGRNEGSANNKTYRELGAGTNVSRSLAPLDVVGLSNVRHISTGHDAGHTCALLGTDITCWGRGDLAQIGNGLKDHQLTPVTPYPF